VDVCNRYEFERMSWNEFDQCGSHVCIANLEEIVMTDNKAKTGKPDRDRINIHESYELRDWAAKFGVSEAKIKEAVGKVGVMVADVKKYLGK
jgi:hypothetical protein